MQGATSLRWWRTQVRDALELFLLPGLAAVLPWRLCFAVFKQLAKHPALYRAATEGAWEWASKTMPHLDRQQWSHQRRLLTLVDHADWALAKTRGMQWIDQHVQIQGQWPQADKTHVVCTFHWGAGMWALYDMRRSGLSVHALAASLEGAHFQGRPVLHAYAKLRTAQVVKAMGHPTIDVTASMRPVLKAIKAHESLLGLVDVPADNFGAAVTVNMLGQKAQVPRGLLRLAADKKLPVTIFLAGLDFDTGQRKWAIESLGVMEDPQELFDAVFERYNQAVQNQPGAWHLWAEMPRFTQIKEETPT
jgi:hypothetical protein